MKFGAQFYSIRDLTTTPANLRIAFQKVSECGFDNAQMSQICPIDAHLLASYSEEFCLPIICTHSQYDRIIFDTERLIEQHNINRCPIIGLGHMPTHYRGSLDGVKSFIKELSPAIERIEASGLTFAYHNHAFEFIKDGQKTHFDIIAESLPSIKFILDTYWVKYAGENYISLMRSLGADRLSSIHFKDMKSEPRGEICHLGAGIIDYRELISLCEELGVCDALIEQDNAPESGDSLGELCTSLCYIKSIT